MAIGMYLALYFLNLQAYADAAYCQTKNVPDIQFCQNGTIMDLLTHSRGLSINGSSMTKADDWRNRECLCHIKQSGYEEIGVDGMNSCDSCGLQIEIGRVMFPYNVDGSVIMTWSKTSLRDQNFTINMRVYNSSEVIKPDFCIEIATGNSSASINLTLSCEGPSTRTIMSSDASFTTPTSVKTKPIMFPNTTINSSSTAEMQITFSHAVAESFNEYNTTSQNTLTSKKPTTVKVTETTSNGEVKSFNQSEVTIPAAAGGGAGLLVVVIFIVVGCCVREYNGIKLYDMSGQRDDMINLYASPPPSRRPRESRSSKSERHTVILKEKRRKHAEKTVDTMTNNPTYGQLVELPMKSTPHIRAQGSGNTYAVVNKGGRTNVSSAEVHHFHVGETKDVYAMVNKGNTQAVPRDEQLQEIPTTGNNHDYVAFDASC